MVITSGGKAQNQCTQSGAQRNREEGKKFTTDYTDNTDGKRDRKRTPAVLNLECGENRRSGIFSSGREGVARPKPIRARQKKNTKAAILAALQIENNQTAVIVR